MKELNTAAQQCSSATVQQCEYQTAEISEIECQIIGNYMLGKKMVLMEVTDNENCEALAMPVQKATALACYQ